MNTNESIANMLGTCLAQAENPQDMRLNPQLEESEVVETIRLAMEAMRQAPPPGKVLIDRAACEAALWTG